MRKIFPSILSFIILMNLMMARVSPADDHKAINCGCPDPEEEYICFNDYQCENMFRNDYFNLYRPLYPEPWTIEIFVIPRCPYGTCSGGLCRNYYDIWVRLFNPVTGQSEEYWNLNQLCETWPCN